MQTEKFRLEFEDIAYEVVNNSKGKNSGTYLRLIDGISGHFESGSVTGIMGPSGSCKTSFLDFITGRIKHNSRTRGVVRFRGGPRDKSVWLAQHCYLEQDDCIVPKQTVYEYILFAVSCRRQDLSEKAIHVEIENVMKQLHISHIASVGLNSLSGGERKRVMVAVEFMVGADVLILDEPTSGLDSHLALELVHMLKTYAVNHNKIVIMTIHQPGSGLFEMIDNLYFFYKGSIIYNGPVSQLDSILESRGLLVSTSLSRPELLFELFTDHSIIKEVRDCKPRVLELIEDKKNESAAKTRNAAMVLGSSRFAFDWSFNAGHLALLYKRSAVLTLRGLGFLQILIIFVFALLFAWLKLVSRVAFPFIQLIEKDLLSQKDFNFMSAVNSFMVFVKDKCPLALPVWSTTPVLYTAQSVCFTLSLFMSSNILSSTEHILRESYKGTYSMTTFFFAVLLLEFTFDCVFATLLLILAASLGCASALWNPRVLLFTYIGVLFPKLLCLLLGIITASGMVSVVVGFVKLFVCSTCSLPWIVLMSNILKGTSFEPFVLLKYPLMLIGINFWKEFFLNGLYDGEFQSFVRELKTATGLSKKQEEAYEILVCPNAAFDSLRGMLYSSDQVRAWLTGSAYPNWVHLGLAFTVAIFTMLATIMVYNARYTPSLRLKHSQ